MKIAFLSLALCMSPFAKAQTPVDHDRLLIAIFEIEQGKWGEPGGRGNICYDAWTEDSNLPYYASANEAQAMPVYRKRLVRLSRMLRAAGVRVNAQTLGTCWRWGFEGARRHHWRSDNGVRTQNLYDDSTQPTS